jgi:hypothetical protein
MLLFQACTGGVSSDLSLWSVSVERWASCEDLPCRFQNLDSDPQLLVFDYRRAAAVVSGNLSHSLGAVVEC